LKAELPHIILYFAIMLLAWIGGLGPAVLGLLLGIILQIYLLLRSMRGPHCSVRMPS
jgi:hypothetical protein